MEEKQIVNEGGVVNGSVNGDAVNSNSVNEVVPKELVELGFPSITENVFSWGSWEEITRDFYNSIYTLKRLYEKHTSKKLKLSLNLISSNKTNYTIFLNNKIVFSCSLPNRNNNYQNLQKLKNLVQELIPIFGSFENLKLEFAKTYAEEKSKIELNEIEFYHINNPFKETKAELEKREKFFEALKNDKELAEKEAFYLKKPQLFGKKYSFKKSNLKDMLRKFFYGGITSIRIYKNLLVIEFFIDDGLYVIKLSKAEKQRVLNIITLLKI